MRLLLRAAAFAAEKHRDQRRKDAKASPYINHPLALADLLAAEGVDDVDVLCAALLHDTIEDTDTSPDELRAAFGGDGIESIVAEVTDDKNLPKDVRKQLQIEHAAGSTPGARLVKLADKICNLRDLRAAPPQGWPVQRKREYFAWARQVVDEIRGTHAGLEACFDRAYREGLEALGDPSGRFGAANAE